MRVKIADEYRLLHAKICEVFATRGDFAKAMSWSRNTCTAKLNGESDWSASEIRKAVDLLKISPSEIPVYFFAYDVRKS